MPRLRRLGGTRFDGALQRELGTEADVRRRVRSAGFTSLLGVMECASAPPLVRFDFVAQSRGLDYVEEIRGGIVERQ